MAERAGGKKRVRSPEEILERGRLALLKELGLDGMIDFLRAVSKPSGRFDKIHKQWQALSMDELMEMGKQWERNRDRKSA